MTNSRRQGCQATGCAITETTKGYCDHHYRMRPHKSLEEKFWSKVDVEGSCWSWIGTLNDKGYGYIKSGPAPQKLVYAHRLSLSLHGHDLTPGDVVHHTCFNTSCVRPDHLSVVDHQTNCWERSGAPRQSRTGIRGVSWSETKGKYIASFTYKGVSRHVGYFRTRDEASQAVASARSAIVEEES